jgi:LPS export ABC transporter protein LptC
MNTRRLSWQLPALILLTVPLWYGAMARFLTLGQVHTNTPPSHQDSRFTLEDVVFSQFRHGTEEAVVHAKSLHGTDDNSLFTLEGADARRLGPRPIHITGGNALYDPKTQILTILDNVVVETADLVVKTQALRYLTQFATLKSAADIEIVGQGLTITGTSFMYNLDSGVLRVGERVHCLFAPSQRSRPTL